MFGSYPLRAPWFQNGITYRIEPNSLIVYERLYHNGMEYHFSCSLYHALAPIQCHKIFEQKSVEIQVFFELEPISSQT
jgi:hypothetical protein